MLEKAFAGNNCLYSRGVIDNGIRYDDRFLCGEDVLFEAEIQAKFPFKMQAMDEVLYLYRKHTGSLTVKRRLGDVVVAENLVLERNKKIKDMLRSVVNGIHEIC